LGAVTVLDTNKKNFLWHLSKGKESRRAGLFLFLAATPIGYAASATTTIDGVFAELSVCVHGFTFYDEK
jgi:hypothetical protein